MIVVPSYPPPALVDGDFMFSSYTGDITKVGLDSDLSLYWTSGDRLLIYSYNGANLVCRDVATLFSGQGSSIGRFAPETYSGQDNWYDPDAVSTDYDFYAWYPAVPVKDPISKVISVSNVCSTQFESSGIGSYLVCWAKAETSKSTLAAGTAPSFSFAPRSSLLKLTIKNSLSYPITINSIKLEADANISGDASLNLETGVLSAGSTSVITYIPALPIVLAAGAKTMVPVNISMLPCAATYIVVTLNDDSDLPSASLSFSGINQGNIYGKVANFITPTIDRTVDIVNGSSKTASSNVLEENRLYYGNANCLVMDAADTLGILNIQLFESADGISRSDIATSFTTAVTSAKVIWAENDLYDDHNFGIVDANLNSLTISKSSGITGNALIGIYDGDENLLWSYHIWAPSDASEITPGLGTNASGQQYSKALSLALGQVTSSQDTYMYYQWGRKDPLGRANSPVTLASNSLMDCSVDGPSLDKKISALATGSSRNNLAYARQNPAVFITYAGTESYDWYPTQDVNDAAHRNDNLWGPSATIYDPCPYGYHVPDNNQLWKVSDLHYNVGDSVAGVDFTHYDNDKYFNILGLEYVRAGVRDNGDDDVFHVASAGYYWSFDVNGRSAHFLSFNDSVVIPVNYASRAYGFGVRCVGD